MVYGRDPFVNFYYYTRLLLFLLPHIEFFTPLKPLLLLKLLLLLLILVDIVIVIVDID